MTTTLTVDIPREWWWSANDRLHWAQVAKRKSWCRKAGALIGRGVTLGYDRATVRVHVAYPKGTGRADPHNVASTVIKAVIDGLVTDAGLLPDDDSRHLLVIPDRDTNTCTRHYRVRLVFTEHLDRPGREGRS